MLFNPRTFCLPVLLAWGLNGCNALPNLPQASEVSRPLALSAAPLSVPGNLSRESYLLILDCYLACLPRNDSSRASLAGHEAQVLNLSEAEFKAVFSSGTSRLTVERNKELAAGLGCSPEIGPTSPAQLSAQN